MNWKNWKVGLFVATLSGIFTGLLCLAANMTGKQILFIMLVNIGKDGLLFIKQNPADRISFDTQTLKRTAADGSSVEATSRTTSISPAIPSADNKEKEIK